MEKKVQKFFETELVNTIQSVKQKVSDADLVFALVTDSHLSDNGEHTRENIAAVDSEIHFNFLVHLGDFLTGNIPEKISRKNLREELEAYRSSLNNRIMYVAQGNHDGYRDESYKGQLVTDMALDENWYEDTCFIDEYKNIYRTGNKPYFYVDYPNLELRLIFLCTNGYRIDKVEKEFYKKYAMDDEEIEWLGRDALNTPSGYTVMVFSHIPPLEEIPDVKPKQYRVWSGKKENYGNAVYLLRAYQQGVCVEVNGMLYDYTGNFGEVACWFFGHDHSDFDSVIDGINYVGTTSQTAYIPQLWDPMGEFTAPRDMDTVNEDAWDVVLWCKKERKIYFERFGAGKDRVITY